MKNRKRLVSILAGILVTAMLLGLLAGVLPAVTNAASSDEIRDQISTLQAQSATYAAEIASLESQMQANLTEIQETVEQKNRIDQQVALYHEQIQNINQQISAYSVMIADKQDELDEKEARYEELTEKNRDRVRAMEEDGRLTYWSVLFKAHSFADLLDRLNMIEEINASDQRRLQELDEAAKAVAKAKDELSAGKAELEDTRLELQEAQAAMEEKRAESDALLEELLSRGDEFEEYMRQAEASQQQLLREIAQKQDDLERAEYLEWLATSETTVPKEEKPDNGGSQDTDEPEESEDETNPSEEDPSDEEDNEEPADEGWILPLPYYTQLTSPFGWRDDPFGDGKSWHAGIDLAAPEGTPIYASRGGRVSSVWYNHWSLGNAVQINHGDGYSSIYMHMVYAPSVSTGDYVYQGQVIGYVGSTGESTGDHLHFGISHNGAYENPFEYI